LSIPILLFVYNRLNHTRRTVESLLANQDISQHELIVFSDGPKTVVDSSSVNQVRDFIATITGFQSVTVHCSKINKGLSRSIIDGVTQVLKRFDSCIVIEDDLVLSPHFLSFMRDGLSKYSADSRVASIHGYVFPTDSVLPTNFFMKGTDCWGWGTWKRAWDLFEPDGSKLLEQLKKRGLMNEFDFGGSYAYSGLLKKQIEGKVDSWAIRWHASIFLENMLTLYPGKSLVHNIGNDRSGTNSGQYNIFDVSLQKSPLPVADIEVEPSEFGYKAFVEFFTKNRQTLSAKVIRKISSLVNHEKE
jgi:glycosyltransferase involved in cell wall biosynthesis